MKNFRYFITGANGLAGSYMLRKIRAEGGKIRALKRQDSNLKLVQNIPDIEWVQGDLNQPNLGEFLTDIDFVIHCAGLVSFHPKDRAKLLKINAEGTANLVNICLQNPIKKFCHLSSVAALGNTQTDLINEKNTWDNRNPASEYALSKHLAEREVWRGIAEGLTAVIVNPAVILGKGDPNQSSAKIFGHILQKKIFYPQGQLNVVDADDVARAVYQLLHADIEAERFVLSHERLEFRELFGLITKELGYQMPAFRVGASMLKIAHQFGQFYALLGGNPALTSATLQSLLHTPQYDASKIKNALNFQFTDTQTSVQKVCHQYQTEN